MGDGAFIGVRHHFVPICAEGADMLFAVGKFLQKQFLRLQPGASAILLDIPVMGADMLEKPFALFFVRISRA